MTTVREEFDSRLDLFQSLYNFHPHDEIVRSLSWAGEIVARVCDDTAAAETMTAIRATLEARCAPFEEDNSEPLAADSWREEWGDLEGWDTAGLSRYLDQFHDLTAFAEYGILSIWNYASRPDELARPEGANMREWLDISSKDVPAWIAGLCDRVDELEKLEYFDGEGASVFAETKQTRDAARARLKYDEGKPLTVQELALLSGVTVKRLQNAIYAKAEDAPIADRKGMIKPDHCRAWLAARDYLPTLTPFLTFPLSSDWGTDTEYARPDRSSRVDDFIFVPVATDGTVFLPDECLQPRENNPGYQIGAKGEERIIANYDDALAELQKLDPPRWRRKSEGSGKWSIVSGQSWKRVRRSELGSVS